MDTLFRKIAFFICYETLSQTDFKVTKIHVLHVITNKQVYEQSREVGFSLFIIYQEYISNLFLVICTVTNIMICSPRTHEQTNLPEIFCGERVNVTLRSLRMYLIEQIMKQYVILCNNTSISHYVLFNSCHAKTVYR